MEKDCNLVLTFSQAENLVEFFELHFIDSIRNDEELDNMNYLTDMCDIYKKLKAHINVVNQAYGVK